MDRLPSQNWVYCELNGHECVRGGEIDGLDSDVKVPAHMESSLIQKLLLTLLGEEGLSEGVEVFISVIDVVIEFHFE